MWFGTIGQEVALLGQEELVFYSAEEIWIGTSRHGVFRFINGVSRRFDISIMAIAQDQKDNVCLGGAGGLHRISSSLEIAHIMREGPWD